MSPARPLIVVCLVVAAVFAQSPCEPGFEEGFGGIAGCDGPVNATAVFDDGTGPALYVTGDFLIAGSSAASRVARFRAGVWEPLGAGFDDVGRALVVHDDGSGPAIYCGGGFLNSGSTPVNGIARWSPATTSWIPVGGGFGGAAVKVWALTSWAPVLGGTPNLYAGGAFSTAGGAPALNIATWNGTIWSAMGSGYTGSGVVRAVKGWTNPSGVRELVIGGTMSSPLRRFVPGIGSNPVGSWVPILGLNNISLAVGPFGTLTYPALVAAIEVYDEGAGDRLFVGGAFDLAGGHVSTSIARWDGSIFSGLDYFGLVGFPAGLEQEGAVVNAMKTGDIGFGPELFIGGSSQWNSPQNYFARWNGSTLTPVAPQPSASALYKGFVRCLSVGDIGLGTSMFVGGLFDGVVDMQVGRIASYSGSGYGAIGVRPSGAVSAMRQFDDGAGAAVFAATTTGGYFRNSIVQKRDASGWTTVGAGFEGRVKSMASFDDGAGQKLYVANSDSPFPNCNCGVWCWNGLAWTLTPGSPTDVSALEVYDDGSGPALYACASFGPTNWSLWRFSGGVWIALGGQLSVGASGQSPINDFAVYDDGSGPRLFAAGIVTSASGVVLNYLGAWNGVQWSGLASPGGSPGIVNQYAGSKCLTLEVHDALDGRGPLLYFGGDFSDVGGVPATGLGTWDGTTLSAVAVPTGSQVSRLVSFNDGGGPALYLVREQLPISTTSLQFFEKRQGGVLSSLPSTVWASASQAPDLTGIKALAVIDEGTGPSLWSGGLFTHVGTKVSPYLARWHRLAPFTLTMSQPGGPLSISLDIGCGPPLGYYFSAYTLDPLNGSSPGAGYWRGLHLPVDDLLIQLSSGAAPFAGLLDAAGMSHFELPAGSLPPTLTGAILYGIAHGIHPTDSAGSGSTPVASLLIQ